MRRFRSINPHNNSIVGQVFITTEEEVHEKVENARLAQNSWAELGLNGRIIFMRRLINSFTIRADEFATLISKEMGMPLSESKFDVERAIKYLTWYIDNADKHLAPEIVFEDSKEIHKVFYEPYGVALVVCDWKLPASDFIWGCGQNLIAGNTVIFKHSEEVPLCGKLIDKIFEESGFPAGVFSQVFGKATMTPFLARQDIDLICFSGNTELGKNLYRIASQRMKKIILRLGNSAPGIVFDDADINNIANYIYLSSFTNSGQTTSSLKRLLVHGDIWNPVIEKIADRLRTVQIGNPLEAQFNFGPLASKRQIEVLERQIADAVEKGASVVFGGKQPGLQGFYFEPTILINVSSNMRVWHEEVFGPVLSVMKFSTDEEAIQMANDSAYASNAYIFSKSLKKIEMISNKLNAGMVSGNGMEFTRPENPTEVYMFSGLGKQQGRWGYQEITRTQVLAQLKTGSSF